jgi:hypothetical protein
VKADCNDITHQDVKTEFLGKLPSERFPGVLVNANFAAGKLPQTREVFPLLSLRQKDAAFLDEDASRHEQRRICGHGSNLARS